VSVAGDDPQTWYEGSTVATSGRRFLYADHQGSVVAIADNGGVSLAINSYDPWGIPAAANQGRFQYTGQAWLAELGMYYYKARLYSPTLGRFLQTDPVGYKDQVNLYAYVGNDPTNRSDPTGLTVVSRRGQEEEVARRINTHARGQYAFTGRNGSLRQVTSPSPRTGSRIGANSYYDRRLMAAIRSEKTITMAMGETVRTDDGVVNINDPSLSGAGTFPDEAGNQLVVVSRETIIAAKDKEGRPLAQTPDDRVMHELVVHAIPNITGEDRGNGLDNENRVRRERGMLERADDPSHPKTDD
jgi:RHS repeat-associated protein